jgi:hypothetical protein
MRHRFTQILKFQSGSSKVSFLKRPINPLPFYRTIRRGLVTGIDAKGSLTRQPEICA